MGINLIGSYVVHKTLSGLSNQISNMLALSFTYEFTKSSNQTDDFRLINTNIKISNNFTIVSCILFYLFGEIIFNFCYKIKSILMKIFFTY